MQRTDEEEAFLDSEVIRLKGMGWPVAKIAREINRSSSATEDRYRRLIREKRLPNAPKGIWTEEQRAHVGKQTREWWKNMSEEEQKKFGDKIRQSQTYEQRVAAAQKGLQTKRAAATRREVENRQQRQERQR